MRFFKPFVLVALALLAAQWRPASARLEGEAPSAGALAPDRAVYVDSLASGWENWSWDTTANFANGAPAHAGTSISVIHGAAWGALYLHTASLPASDYASLRFWINGGAGGQLIDVNIDVGGGFAKAVRIGPLAGGWSQQTIALSSFGSLPAINGVIWQDGSGAAQPVFYLDDIILVGGSGNPPAQDVALTVNADASRRAISPDIYGMNYAPADLASQLMVPLNRWGGNSTSRYNWQTSMSNRGSDWYFQNVQDGTVNVANLPAGSASDQFVEQNRSQGMQTIMTVPAIGWVAKASSPRNHPYDCGFKVSKYGAQQSTDAQWDPDCGNGVKAGGGNITGNDPADTSQQINGAFVGAWVSHLVGRYGAAANNGVRFYAIDNEPMLWHETHRDIHPEPATYDEVRDAALQFAPAIKAADPGAKVLGPALWGWWAYFCSAKDMEASDICSASSADRAAHGGTPFIPWYLQQMKHYADTHGGARILDYLDIHYYPQASGVSLSGAGSLATQELRLRSTRALWDPTYVDESWTAVLEQGKINLIPRMRAWIDANYPGTKLAVTEYNWGGLEHINGALAQADVLGIFGREGVDLATLWGLPEVTDPAAFAFRMYRNYNGAGGQFGNVSIAASSADQSRLAIYGAERSSDGALTLMVINKTSGALTGQLSLSGFNPGLQAQVYRYSGANLAAIVAQPNLAVNAGGLSASFPANSITLLVLPAASGSRHTIHVPLIQR
ncbi:MAG TPA: glycoside hydrolase family 44 protein [Herpetosiphonaceae bacterium]|nr:glycoside hydrolase family 44 protein [Herpetosiphonaceae bacterium]